MTSLNDGLNVLMSLQLPFALIPIITFTASPMVMTKVRHKIFILVNIFTFPIFLLRPRISIRGSVRRFIRLFVTITENRRKRRFAPGKALWPCTEPRRDIFLPAWACFLSIFFLLQEFKSNWATQVLTILLTILVICINLFFAAVYIETLPPKWYALGLGYRCIRS